MYKKLSRNKRRILVSINYLSLLIMEICYYFALINKDLPLFIDVLGIVLILFTAFTFILVYKRTGIWKLTHSRTDDLDEREIQLTHMALSRSYGWFSIICLAIMFIHALIYSLVPQWNFIITVPLVSGLIYLAHTLPGSIIAWGDKNQ